MAMQRASVSIASLAAALAKAQAVLVNPEKSLVGTIPADRAGGTERSFRYASLASGLDIVRKTLGEHEIATMQTTAIDQGTGIVNLTTLLAHSSGEWIASDWPVCPIVETATPRRMGAALTYARRYALFTLVGIAGEDDLDAPDLAGPTSSPDSKNVKPSWNGHLNHNGSHTARSDSKTKIGPRTVLGPAASAVLRDRLVAQVAEIGSADAAALWAYANMRAKNGLTTVDARRVEEAFQAKLPTLGSPTEGLALDGEGSVRGVSFAARSPAGVPLPGQLAPTDAAPATRRSRARRVKAVGTIDKTVLIFPETRRIRDREHVRFVAKQPCLICGRVPSDPHHLRFAQNRALGRKVSDEFTVPLCRGHHRAVHRCGDEAAWWSKTRIDPMAAARALWLRTHPLPPGPTYSGVEDAEGVTPTLRD
jgi:ERF superfamily